MLTGARLKKAMIPHAVRFAAVGHPYRVAIVYLVARTPLQLAAISKELRMPANLVMHHIKALLRADWIVREKHGSLIIYSIHPGLTRDLSKIFGMIGITKS